jgi:hypothetical protein
MTARFNIQTAASTVQTTTRMPPIDLIFSFRAMAMPVVVVVMHAKAGVTQSALGSVVILHAEQDTCHSMAIAYHMITFVLPAVYPLPAARPLQTQRSLGLGLKLETQTVAHLSATPASYSLAWRVFVQQASITQTTGAMHARLVLMGSGCRTALGLMQERVPPVKISNALT